MNFILKLFLGPIFRLFGLTTIILMAGGFLFYIFGNGHQFITASFLPFIGAPAFGAIDVAFIWYSITYVLSLFFTYPEIIFLISSIVSLYIMFWTMKVFKYFLNGGRIFTHDESKLLSRDISTPVISNIKDRFDSRSNLTGTSRL